MIYFTSYFNKALMTNIGKNVLEFSKEKFSQNKQNKSDFQPSQMLHGFIL